MANEKSVTIENATLIFKNFTGTEGPYNTRGDKEFSVILDAENAENLSALGWNVKYLKPRDGDEEDGSVELTPYLPVKVSYQHRPPTIVLITSNARTNLTESSVETLDWADIVHADLIVVPYQWEYGNKTGIKAYLKSLYVTIQEDELALKYGATGDA
jgi:hypothetical protein